jgi:hypothetical protein
LNQKILKELFAFCRENNYKLGVVIVPYMVELTQNHPCIEAYNVVANFCKINEIPVINSFDYFLGLNAQSLWINMFDGHPNSKGQEIIAKAAFNLITKDGLIDN